MRMWKMEVDAELPPAAAAVTDRGARRLEDLLARIPDVEVLDVRPHCDGRFVLARFAVPAEDIDEAMDRSADFLRSSAVGAGIGPVVLVASRLSLPRHAGRG
jgi:hypothetical protein